jgi:hypothetical protein
VLWIGSVKDAGSPSKEREDSYSMLNEVYLIKVNVMS